MCQKHVQLNYIKYFYSVNLFINLFIRNVCAVQYTFITQTPDAL